MSAARARPEALDYAAALVAGIAPRALRPAIDQLRLDLRSVLRDLRGPRALPYSSPEVPPAAPPALADVDPLEALLPRETHRRLLVARGDARMLARELLGQPAPFVVPRPPRRLSPRAPLPSAARRLEVTAVVEETARARTVRLRDASGAPLAFTAGQFLTLLVRREGGALERRSYSLSSSPLDGPEATITIQRIDGGRVSGHLVDSLRPGAVLDAMGPQGLFVAPATEAPRHLVFFAGGSGITPVASIAETALRTEPGTRVTIVHGSRDAADVIFRARLDALVLAHGGRARLVRLLEHAPGRDGAGGVAHARPGRPDAASAQALLGELALTERLPGEDAPRFFLCGPAAMMEAVRGAILGAGVPRERLHEERFHSPGAAPLDATLPTTPQRVTIRAGGTERSVLVAPGKTILEAATAERVPLRSSCAMGGCGACKCRIAEGEVAMEEPNCLTDAEREAGWVLTCVGRPRGPVTLEAT